MDHTITKPARVEGYAVHRMVAALVDDAPALHLDAGDTLTIRTDAPLPSGHIWASRCVPVSLSRTRGGTAISPVLTGALATVGSSEKAYSMASKSSPCIALPNTWSSKNNLANSVLMTPCLRVSSKLSITTSTTPRCYRASATRHAPSGSAC